MTIEARELYCYCTGTHGQRFTSEEIAHGELWVKGLVRGCATQYIHDYCSKGTRSCDIWTEADITEVARQIIAERRA